jgi:glycosyltransferase involved in cell wall biosynthesis
MKIAFIAKEYPPHGNLRVATAIFYPKLARALIERGHEVHVIAQSHNGTRGEYKDRDGVRVHEVGPAPKLGSPWRRLLFSYNAALEARRLNRRHKVQLVDATVFGAEGFFYAIFKSTPLVLETFAFGDMLLETGTYTSSLERLSWKISVFLEKISLSKADHIIANSPATYKMLKEKKGISGIKTSLIWESRIDFDKFKPTRSDIRKRLGIAEDVPLLLYIGWLQARKGIIYLCEVMPPVVKQFPDAVFLLRGEDTNTAQGGISFKQYILDFTSQHDILNNVKIIEEYLSEEDIVDLYSACDVFLFPSLSETFGWPVVEAMACERPVVVTDTGISSEIKSEGMIVVPPKDAKALADGLINFLSLPERRREELGKINRSVVEKVFSFSKMVQAYIEVYEKLTCK